jgi:hypothetical protein
MITGTAASTGQWKGCQPDGVAAGHRCPAQPGGSPHTAAGSSDCVAESRPQRRLAPHPKAVWDKRAPRAALRPTPAPGGGDRGADSRSGRRTGSGPISSNQPSPRCTISSNQASPRCTISWKQGSNGARSSQLPAFRGLPLHGGAYVREVAERSWREGPVCRKSGTASALFPGTRPACALFAATRPASALLQERAQPAPCFQETAGALFPGNRALAADYGRAGPCDGTNRERRRPAGLVDRGARATAGRVVTPIGAGASGRRSAAAPGR